MVPVREQKKTTYAFNSLDSIGNDLLVDLASHIFGLVVGRAETVGELGGVSVSQPTTRVRYGREDQRLGSHGRR